MRALYLGVFACFGIVGNLSAQNLKENDFFKALAGEWEGKGSMTNAQGETTKLTNEIEAKFIDEGKTFTIKGDLQAGEDTENQPLTYKWEFTEHSIEGLYLGRFINQEGDETEFEVSINEAELKARLTQTSGSSGGNRIELTKQIKDGNYIVDFTFIDSDENKTLEGHLTFERVE